MLDSLKKIAFRKFADAETRIHELSYLFWECTQRCNLSCLHCGSDCRQDNLIPDMPADDFLKAVDTIVNPLPSLTVVMTGGEPLLRDDLEKCGRQIRKKGMRWSIVTNGHFYDRERHMSLLNAGMGALTISLDGMSKSHQWLRGSKTNYNKVISAIELAAASKRLNFDVVTCVNGRNISELEEMRGFLIETGVKSWRLFTIVPIGRAASHPELFLNNDQFIQLMGFIAYSRRKNYMDVKFSCEGYVGQYETRVRDSRFFCRAGINIGSVLIDGSISACPNIDRTFSQGNIYRDNFYEVWNQRFKPFRDRSWTRTGQCRDCSEYGNCRGNGFHNWHGDKDNVLVCHFNKTR